MGPANDTQTQGFFLSCDNLYDLCPRDALLRYQGGSRLGFLVRVVKRTPAEFDASLI